MWIRNDHLEYPFAIRTKESQHIEALTNCLSREAQAAQLYLLSRPLLTRCDWARTLKDLGTDALSHHEMLQEMLCQLTDSADTGSTKEALRALSIDDLAEYLRLCMDTEEALLTMYGDMLMKTQEESMRRIFEYLCERKECHIRHLCRMLCAARGGAEEEEFDPAFDGCCEEIEYYTDEKSGRLCCRGKGRALSP